MTSMNTTSAVLEPKDYASVLPLILRYLCPVYISFVGLGAISAAVMSSADSSIVSGATMATTNVLWPLCYPKGSERALVWVFRVNVLLIGALACALAVYIESVYSLWYLCSDLVYVILFPQLVCVIYVKFSNTYGSLISYVVGLFMRLTAGESMIGLRPLFRYPGFRETESGFEQLFPCKTLAMVVSLVVNVIVSFGTDKFFQADRNRLKYDVFHCYRTRTSATGSIRIANRSLRASTKRIQVEEPVVRTKEIADSEEEGTDHRIDKQENAEVKIVNPQTEDSN